MNPQALVVLVLKISILLTMFGFGLQASFDDLLYLLRRPRLLVLSLVAMFVVMPLFTVLITRLFDFKVAVSVALICLAISPVPPLLPKRMDKAGGLASYGLGLTVTAAAVSILYIPLAVDLIGKYFDRPLAMAPSAVAKLVVLSILLPLSAGILVKRLAPKIAEHIGKPVSIVAAVLLIGGVLSVLVVALPTALRMIGDGTLLALITFVLVGMTVGHMLGGPVRDERVVLALSTACRHPALALAIAGENAPNQHGVISAILLYLLLNVILTIPYVRWQHSKTSVVSNRIGLNA